jgi:hypothetical protein
MPLDPRCARDRSQFSAPPRPTLEAAIRYLHDQGMIAAPLAVEDVFVAGWGRF